VAARPGGQLDLHLTLQIKPQRRWAVYQIEGQTEQTLPAGSAFYEAADTIIANFANASDSEPMTFVAFYLLDGQQELIRMLN
jgi:hypothetical protein